MRLLNALLEWWRARKARVAAEQQLERDGHRPRDGPK